MRIGIFGGTFNPPHVGHVESARSFLKAMKLDRLLVIPTFTPPHKEFHEEATPSERLDMCRIAFSSIPCAEISDMEILRGGKSYTYLTLEELSGDGRELYFLCGGDMIKTLDEWMNFERIFKLATVCYIPRVADEEENELIEKKISEYCKRYGARIARIDHSPIEISSTEIRDELSRFGSTELVLPRVMEYIRDKGLYR